MAWSKLSRISSPLSRLYAASPNPLQHPLGRFDRSRQSAIREEEDRQALDDGMSSLCTARFQSVYDPGIADEHEDEDRTCSVADVSAAEEQCGVDTSVDKEWRMLSQDDAYSAMSVGD